MLELHEVEVQKALARRGRQAVEVTLLGAVAVAAVVVIQVVVVALLIRPARDPIPALERADINTVYYGHPRPNHTHTRTIRLPVLKVSTGRACYAPLAGSSRVNVTQTSVTLNTLILLYFVALDALVASVFEV